MQAKQMIKELIQEGFDKEQIQNMDPLEVEALYDSTFDGDLDFEKLEEETTESSVDPQKGDPDWTDFVMASLREDEVKNGFPTCDGLRRLVERFISPIESVTSDMQVMSHDCAAVMCTAQVLLKSGLRWSASSDAVYKSSGDFKAHLTASADTKAKSKCFREILGLTNVYSEEELNDGKKFEKEKKEPAVDAQKTMIVKILPGKLKADIDTGKLIQFCLDKEKGLDDLTMGEALIIIEQLQQWRIDKTDPPEEVLR